MFYSHRKTHETNTHKQPYHRSHMLQLLEFCKLHHVHWISTMRKLDIYSLRNYITVGGFNPRMNENADVIYHTFVSTFNFFYKSTARLFFTPNQKFQSCTDVDHRNKVGPVLTISIDYRC